MMLSDRIGSVKPSQTAHFSALVRDMRARGEKIISLAIGEPHAPVAKEVISATQDALENGHTRYSEIPGLDELRAEIAQPLHHHQAENVIITNGSKQALFSIFQVICNPGDEIIIPLPCWVSFPEQVKLAGGTPVMVRTQSHQLDPDAIAAAIGPRTRAILLNSPNNPTGAVYPVPDLKIVGSLARENDLYIISDEAYARFVYDDEDFTSLAGFKELAPRTIVTGSFSKSFNMTGFRVGYTIAPPAVTRAMTVLQSHLSGNVCTFAQHGALNALRARNGSDKEIRAQFQKMRDRALALTRDLFDCIKPSGAFYLFPDVSRVLKRGQTSEDLAIRLLTEAKVAVMPGEAFGVGNHIRISYAVPEDKLLNAFEHIRKAL